MSSNKNCATLCEENNNRKTSCKNCKNLQKVERIFDTTDNNCTTHELNSFSPNFSLKHFSELFFSSSSKDHPLFAIYLCGCKTNRILWTQNSIKCSSFSSFVLHFRNSFFSFWCFLVTFRIILLNQLFLLPFSYHFFKANDVQYLSRFKNSEQKCISVCQSLFFPLKSPSHCSLSSYFCFCFLHFLFFLPSAKHRNRPKTTHTHKSSYHLYTSVIHDA